MEVTKWVIVARDNGEFFFDGNESEAEEYRKLKAGEKQSIALKRLATDEEIEDEKLDPCWNHPGFNAIVTTSKWKCKCGKC